jgi:hypothetical protein
MIHIVTVHWQNDSWIDIQLKYLNANIDQPFKIYAFLNGLERDHRSKFFYSSSEPIESHAIKLNILADIAIFNAERDDDLLIFIDGDAFPVRALLPFAYAKLSEYRLVAVQRKENLGDMQPHPSCCLTTTGFWREIGGDWKEGFVWKNTMGEYVTDVGGNLLQILNEHKIKWYPMLRSNKLDLHPIWFGIYEDLVYHHGAGFRIPLSRADVEKFNFIKFLYWKIFGWLPRWFKNAIPEEHRPLGKTAMENRAISEKIFASILSDPAFYEFFRREE